MIEGLEPGLQTTVQDGGRPGHLCKGIPPAGAQDSYALRMASLLVGNALPPPPLTLGDPGDAGLEITMLGPRLRFRAEAVVALTGAELPATLDGEPFPQWSSVLVPAGATLEIGVATRGARGYLAVAGGVDVPRYLGSRSTYVRGQQGGLDGRALRAGDVLQVGTPSAPLAGLAGRTVRPELRPALAAPWEIRVVMGPQDHLFTDESVEAFLESEWQLSATSDRMGFRFKGPQLSFRERPQYLVHDAGSDPSNIVDDVIPMGGIQMPSGTEAIVMGVEVPSAGGYAKIATVISADMGRVGQMRPHERARFTPVTAEEAVAVGLAQAAAAAPQALVGVNGTEER